MRVDRGWTQDAMARDAAGNKVAPDAPDAACWCAMGAILAGRGARKHACSALSQHIGGRFYGRIPGWNDAAVRTAEDVAATLRACADRVERGEL